MRTESDLFSVALDPDGIPHSAVALTFVSSIALAFTLIVALTSSTSALAVVIAATLPLWVIGVGGMARRRRARRADRSRRSA